MSIVLDGTQYKEENHSNSTVQEKGAFIFYGFSGNEVFGAYLYLYWIIAIYEIVNPSFCDFGKFLYLLVEFGG